MMVARLAQAGSVVPPVTARAQPALWEPPGPQALVATVAMAGSVAPANQGPRAPREVRSEPVAPVALGYPAATVEPAATAVQQGLAE